MRPSGGGMADQGGGAMTEDRAALRDAQRLIAEVNDQLRRLVERTSARKTRCRLVALRGRLYREEARLGSIVERDERKAPR